MRDRITSTVAVRSQVTISDTQLGVKECLEGERELFSFVPSNMKQCQGDFQPCIHIYVSVMPQIKNTTYLNKCNMRMSVAGLIPV